ncbi:MAG: glycosyltransferase family 39 protein [Salibacteraceae bacterium]
MKKVLHLFNSDKGLFLFLLFVASVLRLFNVFELPYVHDELSALNRINFNSIGEVITHGVKEQDNHPALIQVFLYYWTSLLGRSEFWVKLPFLSMGIASVWLLYKLGKDWFNSTSGLIAAAFLASLQFPIMYSQIARPYISGLFFSLLFVIFWSRFLFKESRNWGTSIGLIFSAGLCSYNHYFSLMFVGIAGITGLFFLNKNNYKWYLITMIGCLIVFIPHLPILWYQMGNKGLNWLGAPSPLFILDHLKFVFHFSTWVYCLVVGIFVLGVYQSKKLRLNKMQIISLIWFTIPIMVGVVYSIVVKPIVQHSMLLFSFPFLLLFITSFLPKWSIRKKQLSILLILFINSFTLIYSRQHYKVFYAQPFSEMYMFCKTYSEEFKPAIIINENPAYLSMYFDSAQIQVHSTFNDVPSPVEFRQQLQKTHNKSIILGNLPQNLTELAKEVYPYTLDIKKGLNHEIVLLSQNNANSALIQEPQFYSKFETNGNNLDWEFPNADNYISQFKEIIVPAENEYGPVFERSLDEIPMNRFSAIKVKLDFKSSVQNNGLIALSVFYKDQEIMWKGISLDEYQAKTQKNNWATAYLTTTFTSVINSRHSLSDYKLKVLYWNKDKINISLKNFEFTIVAGNEFEYATIEPIY